MSLKHTLLGFLNYYPMTGYELKKFFDTSVAHFWNAEQSQIYAALKQLEAEDLVVMRVEMQTDRPNRKVYSITEDGRNELLEWLAAPAEPEQIREPLLIKLFFGRALGRDQLTAVLRAQLADLRRVNAIYEGDAMETVHKFAAAAGMEDDARLWELTVEAGISHHRAAMEWVEHALRQLEQMDDAMFGATPIDPSDPSHIDARTAQKILDKIAEDRPGVRVSTREARRSKGPQRQQRLSDERSLAMTTAQPTAADALAFNPFDPGFRRDPYPTYRRLRNESPVHQSPFGLVLSRHADCSALLRDPRVSSDQDNADVASVIFGAEGTPTVEAESGAKPFLFMDPPDHTRLRGLVNKAFTPRVVEQLRDRVQRIVDELIDAAAAKGQIEVIEDLAYPLPVRVICEMLGVPPEDHETFRSWSRDVARGLDPDFVLPPDFIERRQRTFDQLHEYFLALIAKRRAEPRDDLISALIAAEEGGQVLSEDELVTTCGLLLIAGHETTVNLIANGALALLRHPDQLQRLRDDPSLIRTAVEEVLRFDPPVQMTARIALADIDVGGATFRKGQMAILLLAAANRDETQFANADSFDIGREENRHLAFGMGIHFCVGAPLARVEGQIALDAFARRLNDPQLMIEQPAYKENLVLRGIEALPVRLKAVT